MVSYILMINVSESYIFWLRCRIINNTPGFCLCHIQVDHFLSTQAPSRPITKPCVHVPLLPAHWVASATVELDFITAMAQMALLGNADGHVG